MLAQEVSAACEDGRINATPPSGLCGESLQLAEATCLLTLIGAGGASCSVTRVG
jgi:hypothetical protein